MDRGQIRDEVIDLLEDDDDSFTTARLDRAIQRAAAVYHAKLVSAGTAIDYVRGTYDFTASGTSQDLSGVVTDFDHYRYLVRQDSSFQPLGIDRAFAGLPPDRFARIIPEDQRMDYEYQTGYDEQGRSVCFFTPVLTLNWVGAAPTGGWTLVYARTVRQIPPDTTGASGDDLSYDTIPEKFHLLIAYRAAKNVMGQHSENPDLDEQYASLAVEFENSIRLGTTTGFSVG